MINYNRFFNYYFISFNRSLEIYTNPLDDVKRARMALKTHTCDWRPLARAYINIMCICTCGLCFRIHINTYILLYFINIYNNNNNNIQLGAATA